MQADTIDDFPLSSKKFLRYGLWRSQAEACLGSILILPDYGGKLEDIAALVTQLTRRGFSIASFDWFTQSLPQPEHGDILPAPMRDFRDFTHNLKEIFLGGFLPRLPAPFYGFGIGSGALMALAAHAALQSQIRRLFLVSPLFAPHGHKPGGFFHTFSRFMADMGLEGWRTNKPLVENVPSPDPISLIKQARSGRGTYPYPTLGCYQGLLDAAAWVLSPYFREKMTIPLLCLLSSQDKMSDPMRARQFCEDLRCAQAITLRHSERLPFEGDMPYVRQFWSAFDAFIPGTGAPSPDRSLEDGLVI